MSKQAYRMNIAGLDRDLPLCPISDKLMIGAFVIFGDPELTTACAKALLARCPEHDVLITAESKGIPLVCEMARMNGNERARTLDDARTAHVCANLNARPCNGGKLVANSVDPVDWRDLVFHLSSCGRHANAESAHNVVCSFLVYYLLPSISAIHERQTQLTTNTPRFTLTKARRANGRPKGNDKLVVRYTCMRNLTQDWSHP